MPPPLRTAQSRRPSCRGACRLGFMATGFRQQRQADENIFELRAADHVSPHRRIERRRDGALGGGRGGAPDRDDGPDRPAPHGQGPERRQSDSFCGAGGFTACCSGRTGTRSSRAWWSISACCSSSGLQSSSPGRSRCNTHARTFPKPTGPRRFHLCQLLDFLGLGRSVRRRRRRRYRQALRPLDSPLGRQHRQHPGGRRRHQIHLLVPGPSSLFQPDGDHRLGPVRYPGR